MQSIPARVSDACQRCRRHKSRCDSFRPCSLCVRANVECVPRDSSGPVRKKARINVSRSLSGAGEQREALSGVEAETSGGLYDEASNSAQSLEQEPSYVPREQSVDSLTAVDYGEAESTMGLTRKIFQLGNRNIGTTTTSAIPDGNINFEANSPTRHRQRQKIASVLGCTLPANEIMETLMDEYFASVHWFSLVIYEPKFRAQLNSIADGSAYQSQKGFLLLLSTVLMMASWYRSQRHASNDSHPGEDWNRWKSMLLENTESQMFELMDQTSLATVQTCTLLGSFYVYHGKPNLSFALLGASIKTAQAIGLHREPLQGGFDDHEERKRIWWTVYTWDRFASITYGRPLGINDKDCNVTMPSDVRESPYFQNIDNAYAESAICYSPYQRELNKLYIVASPIIEIIFGIRTSEVANLSTGDVYYTLVRNITQRLSEWRQSLPTHLAFEVNSDVETNAPMEIKIHRLQALSLQLTFDSLIIILQRPFITQQVDSLSKTSPLSISNRIPRFRPQQSSSSFYSAPADSPSDLPSPASMPSAEQWWSAAIRTSRITELPQLAQLATDSHLVAFLAINLFNSAIAMVVCALSEPLSDKAQEAKRYITRIYRLQGLLGNRSTLPKQSSNVLRDVIRMLLHQEEEAMLASLAPTIVDKTRLDGSTTHVISVEDTLRVPLNVFGDFVNNQESESESSGRNANESLRLNDSLRSVQKVFPTPRNGDLAMGSDFEWDLPQNHADTVNNNMITSSATYDNPDQIDEFGGVGNPLYWIWDNLNGTITWP